MGEFEKELLYMMYRFKKYCTKKNNCRECDMRPFCKRNSIMPEEWMFDYSERPSEDSTVYGIPSSVLKKSNQNYGFEGGYE